MREKLKPTIVTITHHMESARKIGDRVALLFGGKILYDAPPEEFLRSSDPAVRQFVEGKREGSLTVEFDRTSRGFGGRMSTAAKVGAFFLVVLVLAGLLIWRIEDLRLGTGAGQEDLRRVQGRGGPGRQVHRAPGGRPGRARSPGSGWRRTGRRSSTWTSTRTSSCARERRPRSRTSGCSARSTSSSSPARSARRRCPRERRIKGDVPGQLRPDHEARPRHRGGRQGHHEEPEAVARAGRRARSGSRTIVENMRVITEELRVMVESNRANVDATMANFREFSDGDDGARRPRRHAGRGQPGQRHAGDREHQGRDRGKLETTADNLNQITGKISEGEGTVGKLVQSDETHKNLNDALVAVKEGVAGLNKAHRRRSAGRRSTSGCARSYLPRLSKGKGYFTLDLDPPDTPRFYRVELSSQPFGRRRARRRSRRTTFPDGHTEVKTDRHRRSSRTTSRSRRSSATAGRTWVCGRASSSRAAAPALDYIAAQGPAALLGRRLGLQPADDFSAHAKLTGRYYFSPSVFVTGGLGRLPEPLPQRRFALHRRRPALERRRHQVPARESIPIEAVTTATRR